VCFVERKQRGLDLVAFGISGESRFIVAGVLAHLGVSKAAQRARLIVHVGAARIQVGQHQTLRIVFLVGLEWRQMRMCGHIIRPRAQGHFKTMARRRAFSAVTVQQAERMLGFGVIRRQIHGVRQRIDSRGDIALLGQPLPEVIPAEKMLGVDLRDAPITIQRFGAMAAIVTSQPQTVMRIGAVGRQGHGTPSRQRRLFGLAGEPIQFAQIAVIRGHGIVDGDGRFKPLDGQRQIVGGEGEQPEHVQRRMIGGVGGEARLIEHLGHLILRG